MDLNDINMETRVRSSMVQFMTLLKFMEQHGDISRLRSGPVHRRRADRLWEELALKLNSADDVRQKSPEKWKKVWTDWKSKTKRKACSFRQARAEGRPARQLTPLEKRILAVPPPWEVKREVEIEVEVLNEGAVEGEENHNSPQSVNVDTKPDGEQMESASEDAASGNSDIDQPEPPVDIKPTIHHQTPPKILIMTNPRQKLTQPLKPTSGFKKQGSNFNAGVERVLDKLASIEMRRLQVEERRDRQQHERELRRIEVETERNHLLRSLVNIARSWVDHQTDPLNDMS